MSEDLAKDHYLVLVEKEQWNKGTKTSKPTERLISINDMESFIGDKYFEKHEISMEILHDPTLSSEGEATGATKNIVTKKKEDYVKEYAELLGVEITDVDPKLTVKQLQQYIEEAKANV